MPNLNSEIEALRRIARSHRVTLLDGVKDTTDEFSAYPLCRACGISCKVAPGSLLYARHTDPRTGKICRNSGLEVRVAKLLCPICGVYYSSWHLASLEEAEEGYHIFPWHKHGDAFSDKQCEYSGEELVFAT